MWIFCRGTSAKISSAILRTREALASINYIWLWSAEVYENSKTTSAWHGETTTHDTAVFRQRGITLTRQQHDHRKGYFKPHHFHTLNFSLFKPKDQILLAVPTTSDHSIIMLYFNPWVHRREHAKGKWRHNPAKQRPQPRPPLLRPQVQARSLLTRMN